MNMPRPKRIEVSVLGFSLRRYIITHDLWIDFLPVRFGLPAEWQVWQRTRVHDTGDRMFPIEKKVSTHRKRSACVKRAEQLLRAMERAK